MAMATTTPSAPLPRSLTLNPSSKTTARSTSLSSSPSLFFSYNVSKRPSRLAISADRPARTNNRGFSCNCLFGLGVPELVVIVGVAALVFGPKKLPEVGRSIGKTVKSFQQAAKEFESELKKDGESSAEVSSSKKIITTVSEEEKQQAAKVTSMKETSQS